MNYVFKLLATYLLAYFALFEQVEGAGNLLIALVWLLCFGKSVVFFKLPASQRVPEPDATSALVVYSFTPAVLALFWFGWFLTGMGLFVTVVVSAMLSQLKRVEGEKS
jgi:hypothetical protein